MNNDEIIEMARQAQVHEELCGEHFIYEFAKLVAAKERVACFDAAYDANATEEVLESIKLRDQA